LRCSTEKKATDSFTRFIKIFDPLKRMKKQQGTLKEVEHHTVTTHQGTLEKVQHHMMTRQ
jgi:hypothetical protein